MSRIVDIAAFFIILVVLTWIFVTIVAYFQQRSQSQGSGAWRVEEIESELHPIRSIFLSRGSHREYFDSVNLHSDTYDDDLYRVRAAAHDAVLERNAKDKSLRA